MKRMVLVCSLVASTMISFAAHAWENPSDVGMSYAKCKLNVFSDNGERSTLLDGASFLFSNGKVFSKDGKFSCPLTILAQRNDYKLNGIISSKNSIDSKKKECRYRMGPMIEIKLTGTVTCGLTP